jgi:hypothetical protein
MNNHAAQQLEMKVEVLPRPYNWRNGAFSLRIRLTDIRVFLTPMSNQTTHDAPVRTFRHESFTHSNQAARGRGV